MRKLATLILVSLLSVSVFAGDRVVIDRGEGASAYKVWVGSTAYEVIDDVYSDIYTYYTIKNIGGNPVWFDFDSSVSGLVTVSSDINGYVTGENAALAVNDSFTADGRVNESLYMKTLADAGTTVQVILFKVFD